MRFLQKSIFCSFMSLSSLVYPLHTLSSQHSDASSQVTIKADALELLLPKIDSRPWKKGFEERSQEIITKEYTLNNEDIDNWSELVSLHFIPNSSVSLSDYQKNFMEALERSNEKIIVHSNLINKTSESIFWEWWIDSKSQEDQHEWIKILKKGNTIIVYRYTTRKLNNISATKRKWEPLISATIPNSVYHYSNSFYSVTIPNTWQICNMPLDNGLGSAEFLSSCDFTTTVFLKHYDLSAKSEKLMRHDTQTISRLFDIRTPLETQENIQLNNGLTAQLFTYMPEKIEGKLASLKLVAKILDQNNLCYLFAFMVPQNDYAERKAEFISILKSFNFIQNTQQNSQKATTPKK